MGVLKQATDESDNPDLRNRGYIYWRMLAEDPEAAKGIILCEKPTISEDAGNLEGPLLDKLLENVGLLSSVYYKPPEKFVKRIRDRINERLDLENEGEGGGGEAADYVDSTGVKKSQYVQEAPQVESYGNLLEMEEEKKEGDTGAIDDLLGLRSGGPKAAASGGGNSAIDDLLGLSYGGEQESQQ